MITNFKIYENKEDTLNIILDKINNIGKSSLSDDEINFLDNYPNADLKREEDIKPQESNRKQYSHNDFLFELDNLDTNHIDKIITISGYVIFPNDIRLYGEIILNVKTHVANVNFEDDEGKTPYDYCEGFEYEFDDFLHQTIQDILKK